jgi:acyl-CoA hydrolase
MGQTYAQYLLVRPQDMNHAGTLFGGVMMARADEMAFVAASLVYPHCTFVTKVFQEFDFLLGAKEGEIIKIEAGILGTGKTSVRVGVRASNAKTSAAIFQTECVLVNVKHGRSTPLDQGSA